MRITDHSAEPFDGIPLILDGGLATLLESRGSRLDDKLWSALLLHTHPEQIDRAQLDYLLAGADIITTASYQATIGGFQAHGFELDVAADLMRSSVRRAKAVCDQFWLDHSTGTNRRRPRVAASIGPYGAYLANGAEYTGDYDLDYEGLKAFHWERLQLLADQSPDVILCETVPSFVEMRALADLSEEVDIAVWLSFCCRDKEHICDGTSLQNCVDWLTNYSSVEAIGVNCVSPDWVTPLIELISSRSQLPKIAYPNSGEVYNAASGSWQGEAVIDNFAELAAEWSASGVDVIGGCCRTTPAHIAAVRAAVSA